MLRVLDILFFVHYLSFDNYVDKLKKISGVEVLEELKKRSQSIRVIMLTGYPTIETARECLKLGASEYCAKPIDKDELEDKVAQVLKNS